MSFHQKILQDNNQHQVLKYFCKSNRGKIYRHNTCSLLIHFGQHRTSNQKILAARAPLTLMRNQKDYFVGHNKEASLQSGLLRELAV